MRSGDWKQKNGVLPLGAAGEFQRVHLESSDYEQSARNRDEILEHGYDKVRNL